MGALRGVLEAANGASRQPAASERAADLASAMLQGTQQQALAEVGRRLTPDVHKDMKTGRHCAWPAGGLD